MRRRASEKDVVKDATAPTSPRAPSVNQERQACGRAQKTKQKPERHPGGWGGEGEQQIVIFLRAGGVSHQNWETPSGPQRRENHSDLVTERRGWRTSL